MASPHTGAHVAQGDTPTCAKNSPVSRVGAAEARYTWIKPHRAVGIPPGERVEHVAVGRGQCRQGRENEALHHRPRLRRCVAARCWTNREPPSEQFAAECFWLLVRVSALMSASLRPSRGRPGAVVGYDAWRPPRRCAQLYRARAAPSATNRPTHWKRLIEQNSDLHTT